MQTHRRIDTHHHILPPLHTAWLTEHGMEKVSGLEMPQWSAEAAIELMDKLGIATTILSVSTPGVALKGLSEEEARNKARELNEFTAQVVKKHPTRFGFFATIPLQGVDSAIKEASYALDELHADGVILLTNYGEMYLGDKAMEPLMEELNSRNVVIFVHPANLPGPVITGIPPFAADFLLNTTRSAINMCTNGWLEKYSNVKIILSHAGGFIPFAAERISLICSTNGTVEGGIARLKKFYYDTALSASPYALPSLLAFANEDHITFGSDYPFAPKEVAFHFTKNLDSHTLNEQVRSKIERENAEKLFPRLKNC